MLIMLMTDIVLKTKDNNVIAQAAGQLFDMGILLFILLESVSQRRVVLEFCIYELVTYMVKNIEFFIKNKAWMKLSNNKLLLKVTEHYKSKFTSNDRGHRMDVFGFHVLNLYEQIRKVDTMLLMSQQVLDGELKLKERIPEFIESLQSVENSNLENCLVCNFMESYIKNSDDSSLYKKFELLVLPE